MIIFYFCGIHLHGWLKKKTKKTSPNPKTIKSKYLHYGLRQLGFLLLWWSSAKVWPFHSVILCSFTTGFHDTCQINTIRDRILFFFPWVVYTIKRSIHKYQYLSLLSFIKLCLLWKQTGLIYWQKVGSNHNWGKVKVVPWCSKQQREGDICRSGLMIFGWSFQINKIIQRK